MIADFLDFIADFLRLELAWEEDLDWVYQLRQQLVSKSVNGVLTKRILLFEAPCVCNF